MLEKFLISIGLKQPESVEEVMSTQQTTVRPSGENRFIDDEILETLGFIHLKMK